MKVIIPAAGTGKRLFPQTHTKPKPMVYIAGKPIIGHILDRMQDLEPEEIILVVGYHREQLISYIDKYYANKFNIKYINQDKRLGLGHSIYITREYVGNSEIMIALGDMIFKSGYREFYEMHTKNGDCAGSVGVKEVDEPQNYGIVEIEPETLYIKNMEEKPKNPVSSLAIAGVYFIRDTLMLFNVLDYIINNKIKKYNEYQLTDALQEMIKRGSLFKTFRVSSWYDCGHAKSLLATNRVLLDENEMIDDSHEIVNSVIIHPVDIGKNSKILNSVIGPYTSIADETIIENSIISDSIIGSKTHISKMSLKSSIVGDGAVLIGKHQSLNIGDSSSILINQ